MAAGRGCAAVAVLDRRGLCLECLRQRAAGVLGVRALQAAGGGPVRGDDRDDLHRYLHRWPHPGPPGPAHRGAGRWRDLRSRNHSRLVRAERGSVLAACSRLRGHQRLRARSCLHRADRHAAEVVPRQARSDHRPGRRWFRLRRRADVSDRPVAHRPQPRRPDQGLPAAGHCLPGAFTDRRFVLPQPTRRVRRPRI